MEINPVSWQNGKSLQKQRSFKTYYIHDSYARILAGKIFGENYQTLTSAYTSLDQQNILTII